MVCNTVLLPAQSSPAQPGVATLGAAETAISLPATPPPSAAAGVFPVSQVHRGLRGVAYTVFEGTQPEAMEVEILGLLHNALGPGQDMILARLVGAKPEYTGVVAGMSGSPVYIDGKLLGALSYRIGQFSKEPIAGITPIAQMFQVRDQPVAPLMGTAVASAALPADSTQNTSPAATPVATSATMQPIETPLIFSGFSPEAIRLWQDNLPASGLTATSGIGGGSSNQAQPDPIVPGSAISAVLVRGDLDISATCTVTYVDAKQLLACGHPITQFGPVSMPMTKAEVLATLASPLNAFKIINTTETVGSFTQDRQSAIGGLLGATARMIPVSVSIDHEAPEASNTTSGSKPTSRKLHFEVVDNPQITPVAIMVSIYQALLENNTYAEEASYRMSASIDLDGYPSVHLDSLIAPTDQAPASLQAAVTVGRNFAQLYDNAARLTNVRSVDVEFEAVPGRQSLQLESVISSATRVHPGDSITIDATVRPYHGEPRNVRIPITLPASLPQGPLRVVVSDAATLDRITQSSRGNARPLDISASIAQMNSLHANDRLYVTLLEPSAQAVLDGRTLAALPISMANVFEPLRSNQEMTLNGESAVPAGSVVAGGMLTGQQVLSLQVE
jgi:SpoIVB peptidase S55